MSTHMSVVGPAPVVFTSLSSAVAYGDYSHYRFRAEVDWIDLGITTLAPSNFTTLRRRLGASYVKPVAPGPGGACRSFIVRLQAPKSWAEINDSILRLAVDHPLDGVVIVEGVEIALDAYSRALNRDDLVDMAVNFYRGATKLVSTNHRASKTRGMSVGLRNASQTRRLIVDGFNIYVGDKADAQRQHIYLKETDGAKELPLPERRARSEFTLVGDKVPMQDFEEWKTIKFAKLGEYFKFRMLKADLDPVRATMMSAKAQIGERRPRKTPSGYHRLYSRSTVADRKLNALASDALRELSRRWQRST